jgi:AcrR family transcriptional regulator
VTSADGRSSQTRERIIEAALETLRQEGFAEASARAIAARGGFNQALIFYHFGSVTNLLFEAFSQRSEDQVRRYGAAAADVATLSDLVGIARQLHAEDMASGNVTAVVQLMAAAHDPQQSRALLDRFEQWIAIVEDALRRATADTPVASVVPYRQGAYAIAAMFLGIELLARLDPERSEAGDVLDMMAGVARLIEQLGPLVAQGLPQP